MHPTGCELPNTRRAIGPCPRASSSPRDRRAWRRGHRRAPSRIDRRDGAARPAAQTTWPTYMTTKTTGKMPSPMMSALWPVYSARAGARASAGRSGRRGVCARPATRPRRRCSPQPRGGPRRERRVLERGKGSAPAAAWPDGRDVVAGGRGRELAAQPASPSSSRPGGTRAWPPSAAAAASAVAPRISFCHIILFLSRLAPSRLALVRRE